MARTLPKCLSSRWRRVAPMPGIESSSLRRVPLPRRSRWNVLANRCASSRIRARTYSSGELARSAIESFVFLR